jgi:Domain of unknown function (DUF4304)
VTPAELKAPIVASLHALLKPEGFRKSGSLFQRKNEDVVHLVELQGSRTNISDDARFTVNIGIFAPAVVYEDIRAQTKPSIPAAHWRERIGFLSAEQVDLWWEVGELPRAKAVAVEVAHRVRRDALPRLQSVPNLSALVQLWLSGSSPGIPPKLRQDFLHRLGYGTRGNAA